MMNQASQQSNNLDKLITQLKQLWRIEHNEQDAQAQSLIQTYTKNLNGNSDTISAEEFAIQKKVLAKTREKIEALQKQLEALEAK
jgi:BMFP domain-containing protein YqiC